MLMLHKENADDIDFLYKIGVESESHIQYMMVANNFGLTFSIAKIKL